MASLAEIAAKAGLTLLPAAPGTARAMGLHLRDAVLGAFAPWTTQFEGYTPFMYTDSKGFVTTGIGNKIDPVDQALGLPWKIGGRLATPAEITQAWNTVKSAFPGVQSRASASLTSLRLDAEGIRALVNRTLKANDALLARAYRDYPNWPADAQLAVNSMAWAMGVGHIIPGGDFKTFMAALNQSPPDFRAAARASHIDDRDNPGLVPRNEANKLLFENAARVLEGAGHPDVLYYLRDMGGTFLRGAQSKKREIAVAMVILAGVAVAVTMASTKR
jgi:GH24 family phage-related lysozyme (muramidase)